MQREREARDRQDGDAEQRGAGERRAERQPARQAPAVQERRLALAQAELDASGEFDRVVVNDDVARAADELVGLLTAPSPGLVPGE